MSANNLKTIKQSNNDASASSFGWNFQANAGIFLFIYYLKDAESIKIESSQQDIEITLKDGAKIFAQAKSAQDYTTCKDKKEKFNKSILSLSCCSQEGDKYIYVSNIPDTFKNFRDPFNEKVLSYGECLQGLQEQIMSSINSLISKQESKVNNLLEQIHNSKSNIPKELQRTHNNEKLALDCLKQFDINKLHICVISFWGEDKNRYSQIENSIVKLLSELGLTSIDSLHLVVKLLPHWQNEFSHNSTVKDAPLSKEITKKNFVWPIVVFLNDSIIDDIHNFLDFQPTSPDIEELRNLINASETIYHERFEFSNRVINEYNAFISLNRGLTVRALETSFVKENYTKFTDEFASLNLETKLLESITKYFLIKIIQQFQKINNIMKGAQIQYDN